MIPSIDPPNPTEIGLGTHALLPQMQKEAAAEHESLAQEETPRGEASPGVAPPRPATPGEAEPG